MSTKTVWLSDTTWSADFHRENVRGVTIIHRVGDSLWYTNDRQLADSMVLPASTFKIPNTLIGIELGLVTEETVFKWDGEPRRLAAWDKDLTLAEAFRVSCVPCYQDLARRIGAGTMQSWLHDLKYGNASVEGGIDLFWLSGDLRISPTQQVNFLERLALGTTAFSEATLATFNNVFVIDTTTSGVWSGKTGLAIRTQEQHGWFVGWVKRPEGKWIIATLAFTNKTNDSAFAQKRTRITRNVFDRFITKR